MLSEFATSAACREVSGQRCVMWSCNRSRTERSTGVVTTRLPLSSAAVKARSAPSWSTVPPAAGGPAQRTRAPAQGRRIGHPFAHKRFGQLQDERAPVRQKLAVLRIARIVEDQVTRGEPVARYAREIRGTAQQGEREIALRGATDLGRTLDRACL
jgi:hypothetical protein